MPDVCRLAIDTVVSPPAWALLERELIRSSSDACAFFFDRYFDERGYLMCVPRWGGNDGPDDAIENTTGWPILHAVGGPDPLDERIIDRAHRGGARGIGCHRDRPRRQDQRPRVVAGGELHREL